ncbi:NAD(P)-dependent malic enzyme [Levilactobacillus koreensis]|uniref:Malate dehydrogenase n=1 Tax=Levilactobacillus koreensis TaxID=637971 RepID=A0AAC8UUM2_9LACO|nr:NADP-dependent malic enzyme [Levilactobacillus koreensis]AKP64044.1 malate dehydrogenase [Levilactobacillus koreensis]
MDKDEIVELHEENTGVLEIGAEMDVKNKSDLGKAYTPGVAQISKAIEHDPELKDKLTMSGKLVAVVTDGSAVLGLGNIGPAGGLPVVEGKALLYKDLAGVNALPLAVNQVPVDDFVKSIKNLSLSFAGIHLEDIAAPRCFEIEEKLAAQLDIPVYHDDQEGTAIVVLAGLINAAKVVNKPLKDLKVVLNGVGASGVATAKLLNGVGMTNITLVDIDGVVKPDSTNYNPYQTGLAKQIGLNVTGDTLDDVIDDQDVFIGLSDADVLSADQVKRMAADPIIFALANPKPEINPVVAADAGATVIATGSSQYANQVNNILVFPGLFKGLLRSGLKRVDLDIEATAAKALASLVDQPTADRIVPGVFDEGVVATVTKAIMAAAK